MSDFVVETVPVDLTHGSDQSEDVDLPLVPPQFHVVDADTASWVVRRINEARLYGRRVAAWAERERRRSQREEEFFFRMYGADLEAFAIAEVGRLKGRRKSISLPGGTIGFRKTRAKLVVVDEAELTRWARASRPDAIVVSETISKTVLNSHFADTGEIPSGCGLEAETEKFYVG